MMLKEAPVHPTFPRRATTRPFPGFVLASLKASTNRVGSLFLLAAILLLLEGCAVPLEEQKAHIRKNSLPFQVLTTQAFLETWGKPTYVHQENTQFYPVKTGNYVPRFRAPLGEAPPGWDASVVSEPAVFLAYVDRGELLGFIDDHLVYREQMTASQIHEIGKNWRHEAIFKTRLETDLSASPKP
ncbi:MAG: hypothetical protein H0W13_02100 [Nitrospirales bacterium]|nr:hypothetical protein [Nitrospirales bacterium]